MDIDAEVGTRARIVTAMVELLRRNGYHGTNVKQVAGLAGAPMGSLYHHFPGGKRHIAAEALRTSGAAHGELVAMVMDAHPHLPDAVAAVFMEAATEMERSGWLNLCPVGSVAAEVADSEPVLRAVVAEVIADWETRAAAYLVTRGLDGDDARDLAVAVIAALEGAFTVCRAQRRVDALHVMGRTMADRVAGSVASARGRPHRP